MITMLESMMRESRRAIEDIREDVDVPVHDVKLGVLEIPLRNRSTLMFNHVEQLVRLSPPFYGHLVMRRLPSQHDTK